MNRQAFSNAIALTRTTEQPLIWLNWPDQFAQENLLAFVAMTPGSGLTVTVRPEIWFAVDYSCA